MNKINQFIMVKEKKIELLHIGSKGIPIVILTGMGCSFYEWYQVTKSLAKSNRVIMFHRPGLGLSPLSEEIRNTNAVIDELSQLLIGLNIFEPVILVGHSYGGLCAQHYAKVFPEKIAGIVLIDSTSVDLKELDELELQVLDETGTDEVWLEKCHSYSLMKPAELKEIVKPTLTDKQKNLPLHLQEHVLDFQTSPALYKTMYLEMCNWKKDGERIKRLGVFPNLPLIVIGRDKEYNIQLGIAEGLPEWEMRKLEDKWEELIMKQARLSKDSELIFAENSSHSIYLDRPDVVIKAIKSLNKIRNGL
ncbi:MULTISPECIES: alpha/beta fold hydrolase [Niallia]|uniref:alpha/beta fold hydrolase n=1 Tax=Niallia TaxID=2837506 RepID=UPI001F42DA84|nr:alpha/beta hydrolase [Niallia circulans]MED5099325.1 alpha/beta hydrolase [Niallia circulans]